MDSIYLHGSEDVRRGGASMLAAASHLEDSLIRHRDFMNDWLYRLEQILIDNKVKVVNIAKEITNT